MNYYPIWLYEFMIAINMPERWKNKQTNKREDGTLSNLAPLLPYVKFEVHIKELGIFKSTWNVLCDQVLFVFDIVTEGPC